MKVVFLDRDNTLNADPGYISKPDQIEILPHVTTNLKLLQRFGFQFIILTNQSGINRGLFTHKQLKQVNNRLLQLLSEHEIKIKDIFICPHIDSDNCKCRKPADGLLKQALKKYPTINLKQSFIIGDRSRDLLPGSKIAPPGILIAKEHTSAEEADNIQFLAEDFRQAAHYILKFQYDQKTAGQIFSNFHDKNFADFLKKIRRKKHKIVTTNGCFDILHAGHIQYLEMASQLGDYLIVGINSDKSVRHLKGDSRPVNSFQARAHQLQALKYVDAVVQFDEPDPLKLLEEIRPSIHTKGGDYTAEQMIEFPLLQKYGGEIVILPFLEGFSTTNILRSLEKSKKET